MVLSGFLAPTGGLGKYHHQYGRTTGSDKNRIFCSRATPELINTTVWERAEKYERVNKGWRIKLGGGWKRQKRYD